VRGVTQPLHAATAYTGRQSPRHAYAVITTTARLSYLAVAQTRGTH